MLVLNIDARKAKNTKLFTYRNLQHEKYQRSDIIFMYCALQILKENQLCPSIACVYYDKSLV